MRRRSQPTAADLLPVGFTYARVDAPPFYATAYQVFLDGTLLGTVASQRFGGETSWGHAVGQAPVTSAGAQSRTLAALNLLSAVTA